MGHILCQLTKASLLPGHDDYDDDDDDDDDNVDDDNGGDDYDNDFDDKWFTYMKEIFCLYGK